MKKCLMLEELLDIFYNPDGRKIKLFHQLRDGRVFVWDGLGLLVTFRYFGGATLYEIEFRRGQYKNKKRTNKTVMGDDEGELRDRLAELFPNAGECNPRFACGYEWYLLESCIHDKTTVVNVKHSTSENLIKVEMSNEAKDIVTKFEYNREQEKITKWFIVCGKRYSPNNVKVPKDMVWIFNQLFLLGK